MATEAKSGDGNSSEISNKVIMPDTLSAIYYVLSKNSNKFIIIDDLFDKINNEIEINESDECKVTEFPELCEKAIEKYKLKCRRVNFKPALIHWTKDKICTAPEFEHIYDLNAENIAMSIEEIMNHRDHYPWATDKYLLGHIYNGYPVIKYVVMEDYVEPFKKLIDTKLYFNCDIFETWARHASTNILTCYHEKMIQYYNDINNTKDTEILSLKATRTKLNDQLLSEHSQNVKLMTKIQSLNKTVKTNDKMLYWILFFDFLLMAIIVALINKT